MAANDIGLSYTEIRRWLAREVGMSRTSGDWDSINTTDLGDILKAGLRQFYWPPNGHIWSFLLPTEAELEVHGTYSEGTVEVEADVGGSIVTLTGGTWPAWAANCVLCVDGERYEVEARSSNSVITLDDVDVDVDSGSEYSLVHRVYTLPDDFGGLVDSFTFRPGDPRNGGLTKINESMMRSLEQGATISGEPAYFCITSVAPTSTQESKAAAMFYPLPDDAETYKVWYRYTVVPPMLDGSSYVYAHGSAEYAETLLLSCLDKALQALYASDEKHAAFLESLNAATMRDNRKARPRTYGQGVYSDGYSTFALNQYRRDCGNTTLDTSNI